MTSKLDNFEDFSSYVDVDLAYAICNRNDWDNFVSDLRESDLSKPTTFAISQNGARLGGFFGAKESHGEPMFGNDMTDPDRCDFCAVQMFSRLCDCYELPFYVGEVVD